MNQLYVGLEIFGLLMFYIFIVYVLSIFIPYLRKKPDRLGDPNDFDYHFFIPCLNEEGVIANTINKLISDFPSRHIWIIDDASDDQTVSIAEMFSRNNSLIHIVKRERPNARKGKGAALNAGYKALEKWLPTTADKQKIIVCVLDADGQLSPNSLEVVSADTVFGDSEVGAA